MKTIIFTTITIIAGIGMLIGYGFKKEEIVTIPGEVRIEKEVLVQECYNECDDCKQSLINCWYEYENYECEECEECKKCEDFSFERQDFLVEIDNLLRSREEAKNSESVLLKELQECRSKLPFN